MGRRMDDIVAPLVLGALTRETITLLIIMGIVAVLSFLLLLVRTNPLGSSERSVLSADSALTPGALRGYIFALVDAQRLSEAEQVLRVHLERLPGDSRFHALAAALAAQRGDHAAAATLLERTAELIRRDTQRIEPEYAALVLIALAVELEALGRSTDAATRVREATALDPSAVQQRMNAIRLLVETARDSELERYAFERLTEWLNGRPVPRALGFTDASDAARFFRRAMSANPGDGRIQGDYAQALQAIGERQEAEKAFQGALRQSPRDAWIHFDAGTLYWRFDRQNDAFKELSQAADLAPRNAAILATLGTFLFRSGKAPDAEQAILAAIKVRPDVAVLARVYGTVLMAQNKVPQAARAFQEAERQGAGDASFRLEYADALRQLDQTQPAEEQYRLACRVADGSGMPHVRYGRFLLAQVRLGEAQTQLEQALILPDGEFAHAPLAGLMILERRLDEALEHLQAALQVEGASTLVQEYQAEWLLLRNRAPDANVIAQRLKEQGVSRGSLYLVLAGTLLAMGRQLEAQAALRESVRLEPGLPATLLQQTRALRALGYTAAALEAVAQALAIAPNWPDALAEQQMLLQEQAGQSAGRHAPIRPGI
ncbi:MAG TPA: tetratricopeptide repeat protein [Ktedonobacterales bacterium]|nr:tetratricopeptide repeat protein [Ktedonobacterales bacterium]